MLEDKGSKKGPEGEKYIYGEDQQSAQQKLPFFLCPCFKGGILFFFAQ